MIFSSFYFVYFLLIFIKLPIIIECSSDEVFTIWGPGLEPHKIVMPARYVFIELVNKSSIISSNQTLFNIKVEGIANGKQCRIRTNLLDRRDTTFILRYKLYEKCDSLQIIVKYNGQHIGESPYNFKNVYNDECNCPITDINNFLQMWHCDEVPKQIISDINQFENINWDLIRDEVIKKYDSPGAISLCHYVIKDNNIYRNCYGKYVGFKMFMDNMLLSLIRKTLLPDSEFFVNLGDWPLTNDAKKYPIFSWCSSTDSFDIVMPTYDISESTLENMGRVMLDMLSVQGNVKDVWTERTPKMFWRGRDSNRERLKLIEISREHPDLFNVSLTNFFFFRDEEYKYGPKSEYVSFYDFFDYKYQISIDGTVAAYRLPYLLGGGSLLFKQNSKYYEHFYKDLLPYVHYVPIKKDLSDLLEKLNWAKENDQESLNIARSGQNFAVQNLLPKNIFCYYVHLLHKFSKKIVSKIQVLDGMEKVESDIKINCHCQLHEKTEL